MVDLPKDFRKIKELLGEKADAELLRIGLMAELEAINLYEQLMSFTEDERIKKVFADIIMEEKIHVGEFLEVLLEIDEEQRRGLERGREEVS